MQEGTALSSQTARGSNTEHGSIIIVLEAARSAIRQQHPEIPAAVIVTGGAHQKGIAE